MRIVVTGAGSQFGRVLIPQLCSRDDISHVVGIDRVHISPVTHPKFSMHLADLRDASFGQLLEGADAVVHLAFEVTQKTMTVQEMRSNNVRGSLNVFRAARANKVRKIVNLSSVSVYGSGEGLEETAPLAPSARLPYACHKAELESIVNTEFADIDTVHLRAPFILGPNAIPFLRKMCTSRLYVSPSLPYPKIQVVHEEDVATAVVAALNPDVRAGVFNIAAPEALTIPELVRNGRLFVAGIPIRLVERLIGRPPSGSRHVRPINASLELLRVTLTVSCERARRVLGWYPRYSAWQARASCDRRGGSP